MRFVFDSLLGGILATVVAGAACAQPAAPLPASAPASAPMTAASRQVPTRNAAITASENAKEPGNQRPEERVIPQISIPLRNKNVMPLAAIPASAPVGSVPGRVNEGAARCVAISSASEKAACERGLAASGPMKSER
ncbi:hypothetical protein [Pelomonas sp. Root1237]|uniref:hypothetical protein n=1 Tax=Pelomonas sp. Root1237 TaxID=1736434 RepID=UPI000AEF2771|nr:hypothetical protein [Pelomonas sp. Root1237]